MWQVILNLNLVMFLIEGNDVASNIKWVMSSNSLVIMPRVKFETWFMEGELKPNVHYAEIKDNYENLEELLEFFIKHSNDAKEIIHNAHEYVKQFFDKEREFLISLLLMGKYFYYTNQIEK
ncbi:Glycosyl transferase family 90 [Campylobacter helveticus]|uniref:glycosyl transferase family 90 n=2 Tax=Campylobacter helveticus TaxID=28898 RepID=UPI0009D8F15B|nr:glycosyl transferase family 90 [Campylobacter helveticus]SMC23047.1 Glycosyl transferase family 90 [Campylobacter helveticus]SUW82338.1 lipopolysaccharide core biosynthesis protein [Campylobacter helveticus]